jgi:hypothetical protein
MSHSSVRIKNTTRRSANVLAAFLFAKRARSAAMRLQPIAGQGNSTVLRDDHALYTGRLYSEADNTRVGSVCESDRRDDVSAARARCGADPVAAPGKPENQSMKGE